MSRSFGAAQQGTSSPSSLVPVTYEAVIESLVDGVIILDAQDRVVALNRSAEKGLRRDRRDLIGQAVEIVFAAWPDLVKQYKTRHELRAEVTQEVDDHCRYYELRITSLYDQNQQRSGAVLVVHDITAHKRVEHTLHHKADELAAERKQADTLREVTNILNRSLDRQEVLQLILEQLEQVISYDSASVFLVSAGNLELVAYRKFRSSGQISIFQNMILLPHVQEVFRTRLPVIIPDTEQDPRWKALSHSNYIRCWMGIPLIDQDQPIGLLNLDREQPGSFTEQETRLAVIFANQASTAITNARLFANEKRRVEELDALQATVADISAELELSRLLEAVLMRAVLLLDATGGDLGLYHPDRQELKIVASHNLGKDYTGTSVGMGEGAMGYVVQTLKPLIVENYQTWEGASPQYKDSNWYGALAVPMLIGSRLVGVLGVVDLRPTRKFTTSDQHLLGLFAQQAAIAVENARLYQAAREASQRRAILHQASQAIVAASMDTEAIYTAIHRAAEKLMAAEVFVITILDADAQQVQPVYLYDRGKRETRGRFPSSEGLSGQVIMTGQPYIFSASTVIASGLDKIRFGSPPRVNSVMAVPMTLGDKVTGMLSVQSYLPDAYTQEDLRLLEMLASYAAIALDNARLFGEVQRLAITDSLTDVFNRRHLFELSIREFTRSRRFNRPLSAILLDIDHFKQVNDQYGHAAGDKVLKQLAQMLKMNIREIDILGRYGGEEFVIILPETPVSEASAVAERLRKQAEELRVEVLERNIYITISLGVVMVTEAVADLDALLRQADVAMYDAKRAGRNRVVVAQTAT